jgi:hypothetical protein
MQQKTDRHLVRQFLEQAGWVTVPTVAIFIFGNKDKGSVRIANALLTSMSKAKKRAIKRLPCSHAVVYAPATTKLKRVGTALFDHDNKTRECVAKWVHTRGLNLEFSFRPPADATVGNFHFEMDNGHMNEKQLREKIFKNYKEPGAYQVVFFMASPYKSHWRTIDKIKADEHRRLQKLFLIAESMLPHKPNRILAASYEQFLADGKLYNFKGSIFRK